jgi:hypothetical protein
MLRRERKAVREAKRVGTYGMVQMRGTTRKIRAY